MSEKQNSLKSVLDSIAAMEQKHNVKGVSFSKWDDFSSRKPSSYLDNEEAALVVHGFLEEATKRAGRDDIPMFEPTEPQ